MDKQKHYVETFINKSIFKEKDKHSFNNISDNQNFSTDKSDTSFQRLMGDHTILK